jgi:hypothetical protein
LDNLHIFPLISCQLLTIQPRSPPDAADTPNPPTYPSIHPGSSDLGPLAYLAIITDVVVVIVILVVIILHNLPLERRTPVIRLGTLRYVVFVVFLFLILISIFLFILLCQHRDGERGSAPTKRTL